MIRWFWNVKESKNLYKFGCFAVGGGANLFAGSGDCAKSISDFD